MVNTNRSNIIGFCTCTWVFLFSFFFCIQSSFAQGLRFNSNDSLINKRTSYDVFEHDAPTFNDHLDIDFDLSLWDIEHFGYILNITDKHQNSYSLTYNHSSNQGNFYFNIDGKLNKLIMPVERKLLVRRNWIKVHLQLNLKKDEVIITLNNKHYQATGFEFNKQFVPKVVFGRNERYTDVPEMAIRNLRIRDASKTYDFPLDEWKGESVHEKQGASMGLVKNPNWLINESYSWRALWNSGFNTPVGLNFDSARNSLLIYGRDSLLQYNVLTSDLKSAPYSTPGPLQLLLGKNILDIKGNRLFAYELSPQQTGGISIAELNLNDRSWKALGHGIVPEQRHHHNSFFNERTGDFYIFGGYGGFAYHNEFFEYNKEDDTWDKIQFSGDQITPRFFSAAGQANNPDEFYVFGGYGNQSGNQVVGGVHYYDLYRVDLKTKHITKCWEIKPKEKAFVPANNLILSKDGKYFYVLGYPHEDAKTFLRLYRFSILDGQYDVVSDKIPVISERIESDINLFFDNSSNQFFCAVQEFTSPQRSTVKVYTLANPPVTEAMFLQGGRKDVSNRSIKRYDWLAVAVLVAGGLLYMFMRKQKTPIVEDQENKLADVKLPEAIPTDAEVNEINALENANSIYLLGDFTVFDNQARNISHLFSPKIQQLFVLILLNSKSGDGVTSRKISACLWPEKEISNSKNIKGVTISNLRGILRDLDGIELTFLNDHYRFTIDPHVFCDYFKVCEFLDPESSTFEHIGVYLKVMLRGSLLPSMQDSWLDDYKNAFDQSIIERLQPELEQAFDLENFKLTLDLARVILQVDPFNDQALKLQLNAIRRIKGKDAAAKCFQQFKADYQASLGIAYPLSFEELLD